MLFRRFTRPGALGLAITAYNLWRRLPPSQRRQILNATRRHAPRVARAAADRRRRARRPRP